MDDHLSSEDRQKLDVLLGDIARLRGSPCRECGATLCAHQVVIAVAMGFKAGALCVKCIASGLERPYGAFLDHVRQHIAGRPCLNAAWLRAGDIEGTGSVERPRSLWPMEQAMSDGTPKHDAEWDAGDMGCGDLVLELRLRLKDMAAGKVLKLRATDPGAPEDIPAWCGLTGHSLTHKQHPNYWIKRK